MKISQEEIVSAINAYCNAYSPEPTVYPAGMRKAIEAALKVRRARKQAKRERQRKEKDKQVVESVMAQEFMDGINEVNKERAEFRKIELECEAIARGIVYPSQAPEYTPMKPHLAPYYGDGRNAGPDFVPSPKASASKAPEWDGTLKGDKP